MSSGRADPVRNFRLNKIVIDLQEYPDLINFWVFFYWK